MRERVLHFRQRPGNRRQHGHAPGETNPIASTDAFARFIDGHGERRQGEVDQQNASLVGAYLTVIG